MGMMVITKMERDAPGAGMRMGTLSHISAAEIEARLGFPPERHAVEGKSDHEWRFLVAGTPCAIWDWRGGGRHRVWSTSGPAEIFSALFGWRATP